MPSITLKYGTFTNSSGQSTFHMALIVSSPDSNFIVQSDENGNLSSNVVSEISREYTDTQIFEINPYPFARVLRFIANLRKEEQSPYKCGTYVLFLLQLAKLFHDNKSDFPVDIPAEIAQHLYGGTEWNPDIEAFTKFAATINKDFTPELMFKLSSELSQKVPKPDVKSQSKAEPKPDEKSQPKVEPKPDVKSQPESDTGKKIKLFKRMYKALSYGESSFLKKDFLADKAKLADSALESEILKAHHDSQAKLAWDLVQRYFYLYGKDRPKDGNTFTIQKPPQLFLSLIRSGYATVVTVSVHDKDSKRNKILFVTGIYPLATPGFFNTIPATLIDKYNEVYNKLRKITYQSFEITISQYQEFLQHVAANINIDDLDFPNLADLPELENIPGKSESIVSSEAYVQQKAYDNAPAAFIPQPSGLDKDNGSNKMEFKYLKLVQTKDKTRAQIAAGLNPNSPYNTYSILQHNCRHVGIELFDAVFKQQQGRKLFSSNGLTKFPYTGLMYNGDFIGNHYIFPAPPNKDTLDPKLYKILARLYKRLEEIPKLKPDSQLTMDKFNALKDLYHSLAPEQPLGFEQLLTVINTWESTGENKDIVDTHRGVKFFSNTSTRNSITELKTLATPSCSWFGCS